MKDKVYDKLQKSIDNMQGTQDIMKDVVISLCDRLGRITGYKFKKKKEYRVYVNDNGKEYDIDGLIKLTDNYLFLEDK